MHDGSVERSSRHRLVAWALVGAQALLILALVLLPYGEDWPVPGWLTWLGRAASAAGVVVMLLGSARLGRGLTASPVPNQAAQLRVDGLYAWVRHPIYSGLLLLAAGLVVVSGSLARLGVLLGLVVLLSAKARWEEARLAERFPDYPAYAARVPRFVPRPGPRR